MHRAQLPQSCERPRLWCAAATTASSSSAAVMCWPACCPRCAVLSQLPGWRVPVVRRLWRSTAAGIARSRAPGASASAPRDCACQCITAPFSSRHNSVAWWRHVPEFRPPRSLAGMSSAAWNILFYIIRPLVLPGTAPKSSGFTIGPIPALNFCRLTGPSCSGNLQDF